MQVKEQEQPTRDSIVNAAIECINRWGADRFSMADLAKEANVVRSTIYMYFKTRDEVIRAALLQQAYSFGEKLFSHIAQFERPEEKMIEAVYFCAKSLPDEPFLTMISSSVLSDTVREHTLTTAEGMDIGSGIIASIIPTENMSQRELHEIAEYSIRFVLSLITMESPLIKTDEDLKGFIARRLLPAVKLNTPEIYLL